MTERTTQEIIDDFLVHLDAGDYIIHEEIVRPHTQSEGYKPIKANLKLAIETYTNTKHASFKPEDKNSHLFLLHEYALHCLNWLRKARMENLIEENPSFRTMAETTEQENENLRELNNKLSRDISHLEKLNRELNETIKRITAKGLSNASGETP